MSSQVVSTMEKLTGSALLSEIFAIPLIIRGKSDTRLLKGTFLTRKLSSGLIVGRMMPTVFRSKPMAKLFSGTIFGRIGVKEIIKSKKK
jgi:hypothetical protein